ncbi:MAG: DUF1786 family protein [Dehalococcoidia bacterium]|nr:DUF1786 family protein [Dehalococcoidia bacterium]
MRLLAIDVGGHTQDILLFDTGGLVENCFNMIMPSPTTIVSWQIREATAERRPVVFTGVNAGGGPSFWALQDHLKAGLKAYSTPEAAVSFDDDLDKVVELGVKLVSADEAKKIRRAQRVELKDIDLAAILVSFRLFGIEPTFQGLAVGVLDHGVAPKGKSDRFFRFEHLRNLMNRRNELIAMSYTVEEIPSYLTRMKAVADSLSFDGVPLVLMDTGPAAALGALEDRRVAVEERLVTLNMGNFHTLAFHISDGKVLGFFEHHTGLLNARKTDSLVRQLVAGTLTNEDVFAADGHGAWVSQGEKSVPFVTVTGPQRNLMSGSRLKPYFATPYGSMMLAGCFGLVRAFSLRVEQFRGEIEQSLKRDSAAGALRPRPASRK